VDIPQLISTHGLLILAPLSIIEGPVVSIVAGWLVSLALLQPLPVFICVVAGDLIGDSVLYFAGRSARLDRWPLIGQFLKLRRATLVPLIRRFRDSSVRILAVGKLTHAAGFAVLLAAGAAKVPYRTFFLVNLLVTIPKSLALLALGYGFGAAHARLASWLSWGSALMVGLLALGVVIWFLWRRHRRQA